MTDSHIGCESPVSTKSHSPTSLIEAEILLQALEMLAIGNVAVHRAQARNRAQGIANYYSVCGRIVSDAPAAKEEKPDAEP